MEDKNYKKFHFVLLFGKTNEKIFEKAIYPILGLFFPNLGKNELSTSCKKLENYGANSKKGF